MMVGPHHHRAVPQAAHASCGDDVLEVRNLTRRPQTIDVSFKVRGGEIVGIAGLVGSGRSETAQVVFGILQPDSGEVLIEGRKVDIRSPGQAMRLGIAYVPEDRGTQGLVAGHAHPREHLDGRPAAR